MDDYTAEADRLLDKISDDVFHLERILDGDAGDYQLDGGFDNSLAISVAKRVRRDSTLLVRALARHRDHATGQEATST